ncbi:hypothetical protein HYH03_006444 [Edaphochlamys debaryana]|uniref:SET domain-containing protein n=1 Tax=Edaphochlamys debaryana TaxID=47281 RepID=A0A835YAT8_9CHLO|nr:hypothetical protein HYH03_006444 [Edaphochlamys debaryana]|eukprot:KAG2495500.1 hypothetical protein HYH03_006444 [Edaphochlamys debaryana]
MTRAALTGDHGSGVQGGSQRPVTVPPGLQGGSCGSASAAVLVKREVVQSSEAVGPAPCSREAPGAGADVRAPFDEAPAEAGPELTTVAPAARASADVASADGASADGASAPGNASWRTDDGPLTPPVRQGRGAAVVARGVDEAASPPDAVVQEPGSARALLEGTAMASSQTEPNLWSQQTEQQAEAEPQTQPLSPQLVEGGSSGVPGVAATGPPGRSTPDLAGAQAPRAGDHSGGPNAVGNKEAEQNEEEEVDEEEEEEREEEEEEEAEQQPQQQQEGSAAVRAQLLVTGTRTLYLLPSRLVEGPLRDQVYGRDAARLSLELRAEGASTTLDLDVRRHVCGTHERYTMPGLRAALDERGVLYTGVLELEAAPGGGGRLRGILRRGKMSETTHAAVNASGRAQAEKQGVRELRSLFIGAGPGGCVPQTRSAAAARAVGQVRTHTSGGAGAGAAAAATKLLQLPWLPLQRTAQKGAAVAAAAGPAILSAMRANRGGGSSGGLAAPIAETLRGLSRPMGADAASHVAFTLYNGAATAFLPVEQVAALFPSHAEGLLSGRTTALGAQVVLAVEAPPPPPAAAAAVEPAATMEAEPAATGQRAETVAEVAAEAVATMEAEPAAAGQRAETLAEAAADEVAMEAEPAAAGQRAGPAAAAAAAVADEALKMEPAEAAGKGGAVRGPEGPPAGGDMLAAATALALPPPPPPPPLLPPSPAALHAAAAPEGAAAPPLAPGGEDEESRQPGDPEAAVAAAAGAEPSPPDGADAAAAPPSAEATSGAPPPPPPPPLPPGLQLEARLQPLHNRTWTLTLRKAPVRDLLLHALGPAGPKGPTRLRMRLWSAGPTAEGQPCVRATEVAAAFTKRSREVLDEEGGAEGGEGRVGADGGTGTSGSAASDSSSDSSGVEGSGEDGKQARKQRMLRRRLGGTARAPAAQPAAASTRRATRLEPSGLGRRSLVTFTMTKDGPCSSSLLPSQAALLFPEHLHAVESDGAPPRAHVTLEVPTQPSQTAAGGAGSSRPRPPLALEATLGAQFAFGNTAADIRWRLWLKKETLAALGVERSGWKGVRRTLQLRMWHVGPLRVRVEVPPQPGVGPIRGRRTAAAAAAPSRKRKRAGRGRGNGEADSDGGRGGGSDSGDDGRSVVVVSSDSSEEDTLMSGGTAGGSGGASSGSSGSSGGDDSPGSGGDSSGSGGGSSSSSDGGDSSGGVSESEGKGEEVGAFAANRAGAQGGRKHYSTRGAKQFGRTTTAAAGSGSPAKRRRCLAAAVAGAGRTPSARGAPTRLAASAAAGQTSPPAAAGPAPAAPVAALTVDVCCRICHQMGQVSLNEDQAHALCLYHVTSAEVRTAIRAGKRPPNATIELVIARPIRNPKGRTGTGTGEKGGLTATLGMKQGCWMMWIGREPLQALGVEVRPATQATLQMWRLKAAAGGRPRVGVRLRAEPTKGPQQAQAQAQPEEQARRPQPEPQRRMPPTHPARSPLDPPSRGKRYKSLTDLHAAAPEAGRKRAWRRCLEDVGQQRAGDQAEAEPREQAQSPQQQPQQEGAAAEGQVRAGEAKPVDVKREAGTILPASSLSAAHLQGCALSRAVPPPAVQPGELRLCGLTFHPELAPGVRSAMEAWEAGLAEQLAAEGLDGGLADALPEQMQIQFLDSVAQDLLKSSGIRSYVITGNLACLLGLSAYFDAPLPMHAPQLGPGSLAPGRDEGRGGAGLFAAAALRKGAVLGVLGGYVMPKAVARRHFMRGFQALSDEATAELSARAARGAGEEMGAAGGDVPSRYAWQLLEGSFHLPMPGSADGWELSMLGYGSLPALINDPRREPRGWVEGNDVGDEGGAAARGANCAVVPVSVRGLTLPVVVALRDIQPGEQLLRDYGADWWRRHEEAWALGERFGLHSAAVLHSRGAVEAL